MKQTAVESIIKFCEQMANQDLNSHRGAYFNVIKFCKDQAKEMEKQEQENFASWCIKKRVDFFDSTEIGETYTIDGFVSRYKMNELLEIYKKEKGL